MISILNRINRLLFPDSFKLQTFTYYIPSPPERKNGYREKEFDRILLNIIKSGFELKGISSQGDQNGMWLIATLMPQKKGLELHTNLDYDHHETKENEIEGLYYIQD